MLSTKHWVATGCMWEWIKLLNLDTLNTCFPHTLLSLLYRPYCQTYLPENKSRSYVHRKPQYFLTSQSLNLKSQHSTVPRGILIEISPLLTPASTTMFKHVNTYRHLQLENRSCLWKVYPENVAAEPIWLDDICTSDISEVLLPPHPFSLLSCPHCSLSSTGGQFLDLRSELDWETDLALTL